MISQKYKYLRVATPKIGVLCLCVLLFLSSCSSFKKGHDEKNRKQNSPVVQEDVNTLLLDATQALMLEKNDEAFEKFTQLVKKDPKNATAHYQLSRLWIKKSNLRNAISEIKLAEKYDPNNKWILDYYANLMVTDQQFLKAAELYGRLIQLDNTPEEYLERQALSYSWAKKYKEALGSLNQLQSFSSEFNETLQLSRAKLFIELNMPDSAHALARELINHAPDNPEYTLLLSSLYFKEQKEKQGIEVLEKFDHEHPDNLMIQATLLTYFALKEKSAYEPFLKTVLFDRNTEIEDRLSLLLLTVGDKTEYSDSSSKKIIDKYLPQLAALDTVGGKVKLAYGLWLKTNEQENSAIDQFKESLNLDSMNVQTWGNLLASLSTQEQPDSLIHYARKAEEILPDNPFFNYYLSLGHLFKKQSKEAIEAAEAGLKKISPQDSFFVITFTSLLGDAYQDIKEYQKADSNYRRSLKYDGKNISVLNNYSYFLAQQGKDLDKALKMSEITIKERPNESTFLDTYAWVLYKRKEYKSAKKYMDKAISLAKENERGVMYEHLGDIEYKLGNPQLALINWLKAKDLGEDSEALIEKIKTKTLND